MSQTRFSQLPYDCMELIYDRLNSKSQYNVSRVLAKEKIHLEIANKCLNENLDTYGKHSEVCRDITAKSIRENEERFENRPRFPNIDEDVSAFLKRWEDYERLSRNIENIQFQDEFNAQRIVSRFSKRVKILKKLF